MIVTLYDMTPHPCEKIIEFMSVCGEKPATWDDVERAVIADHSVTEHVNIS